MTHSARAQAEPLAATPTRPERLTVIFNPTAGGSKRRRLRRTLRALEDLGCRLTLLETTAPGDAERLAAATDCDATDALVVAGGDGTVNEVVNGLLALPAERRPTLAIIPLGTANVLALEMGLRLDPASVARGLVEGRARTVCLAEADGRHFLLMVGAGFDAHVVENVKLGLKRHTGKLAYVWETLWQALHYRFPTIRLRIDGTEHEAATAVVCNGCLYGGPFVAVADGDLCRPGLSVVLLTRKGYWNVMRYGAALALGKLGRLGDVRVIAAREVEILEPVGGPLQADGDAFGHLPRHIRVSPETLNLIYPA